MFIGRTDAEAETPILWPPDAKNWLIWKDPYVGKDWRWEEKGMAEDEMVGWHHQINGHKSEWTRELVMTGRPGMLQSMGLQKIRHDWVTELNCIRTQIQAYVNCPVSQRSIEILFQSTLFGLAESFEHCKIEFILLTSVLICWVNIFKINFLSFGFYDLTVYVKL